MQRLLSSRPKCPDIWLQVPPGLQAEAEVEEEEGLLSVQAAIALVATAILEQLLSTRDRAAACSWQGEDMWHL